MQKTMHALKIQLNLCITKIVQISSTAAEAAIYKIFAWFYAFATYSGWVETYNHIIKNKSNVECNKVKCCIKSQIRQGEVSCWDHETGLMFLKVLSTVRHLPSKKVHTYNKCLKFNVLHHAIPHSTWVHEMTSIRRTSCQLQDVLNWS